MFFHFTLGYLSFSTTHSLNYLFALKRTHYDALKANIITLMLQEMAKAPLKGNPPTSLTYTNIQNKKKCSTSNLY